jgi:alkylation response protein AidB-like acyl-CoA dehydrogenase
MNFSLDETQETIAQIAAGVLTRQQQGSDAVMWKALGEAGLLSLAVPVRLGGEGLGIAETAVLLTEVGRHAVAVPALATLVLGVLPVARWGSRKQQDELLPDVATGELLLTAALREPGAPMPATPGTTGTPVGDTLVVTGTKLGVPYAGGAYRVLVPVSLTTGGTRVAVVDPAGPGVMLSRTPSATGAPEYTMEFLEAPAEPLGADVVVTDLYRLALAGACALGDGVLAGALDLTRAHVGTRQQFGRPLAAFQAVSQQIADVYIAARTLHLATLSACWRLAEALDVDADLDVAAYWLAEEAPAALRTCHHLHGGLGVDVSYPLHRYSSWGKDLARFVGGADYRLDRLWRHDAC